MAFSISASVLMPAKVAASLRAGKAARGWKGAGVFGLSPARPLGYFSTANVGDVAATAHRHL